MTSSEWFDSDEALLSELRAALTGAGPVPPSMVDAAREAYAWRHADTELALLVLAFDSLLEEGAVVRDTSDPAARTLVFDGDGLSLEVELRDEIEGQLIPPQTGHIELLTAGGTLAEAHADSVGCFRLPRPERGPVRLRCTTAQSSGTTDWWPV
jgi:hypothetical protein